MPTRKKLTGKFHRVDCTHGLVVDRMNIEEKGGMGLGPPSFFLSSSSSSSPFVSSFLGRGSVLAFLLTVEM